MAKQLPLSKNWIPPRARFRSFVRRHRDLLPFVGGLIVSLTLTTRESARDHYRELSDSIQGAESFYRLEHTSQLSLERLDSLGRELTQKPSPMQAAIREALFKAFHWKDTFTEVGYKLHVLDSSLESTARLISALDDPNLNHEAKSVREQFVELKGKYEDINKRKLEFADRVRQSRTKQEPFGQAKVIASLDTKTLSEDEKAISNSVLIVESDGDTLTTTALARGEAKKELLKHQNALSEWTSWFLYSVGLMLTLTGKVFGAKDDDSSVE